MDTLNPRDPKATHAATAWTAANRLIATAAATGRNVEQTLCVNAISGAALSLTATLTAARSFTLPDADLDLSQVTNGVTGSDTRLVTGTAGTDGHAAAWDTNGDVVDTNLSISGVTGAALSLAATLTAARTLTLPDAALDLSQVTGGLTGDDAKLVTGTAGDEHRTARWDGNGDLIEGSLTDDGSEVNAGIPVKISTVAGDAGLEIRDGSFALLVGADAGDTSISNSAEKWARIGIPHYTTSEEPVGLFYGVAGSTDNTIHVGGGSSSLNAVTKGRIYAAANNTTQSGTAIIAWQYDRVSLGSSVDLTNAGGTPNIGTADDPFGTTHTQAVNLGDEDLDTYDTGSWTPAEANVTLSTKTGAYVCTGEGCHISCDLTWPSTADANDAVISGLPFTSANNGDTSRAGLAVAWTDYVTGITVRVNANASTFQLYDLSGNALTNADLSEKTVQLGGTYETA